MDLGLPILHRARHPSEVAVLTGPDYARATASADEDALYERATILAKDRAARQAEGEQLKARAAELRALPDYVKKVAALFPTAIERFQQRKS